MPVRVLGKCGGYTSDIADGIAYAVDNGAKVINMSLGGYGDCGSYLQSKINYATNDTNKATVVVAAGNSSDDASNYSPANCSNVITVAATNRLGGKAGYSNFGNDVDLAAPGGDSNGYILSTLNDGSTTQGNAAYSYYQGTSMATPHVAAAAGLLYVQNSNTTPVDVEWQLVDSARPFPASCSNCGSGILDAGLALNSSTTPPPTVTVPEDPAWNSVTGNNDGTVRLSWIDYSDNEDGFTIKVSRKLNRKKWSGYELLANVPSDQNPLIHTIGAGTYHFSIESYNSAGNSEPVFYTTDVKVTDSSGDDGSDGGGSTKCHPRRGC
jgi:serine protease